MLLWDSVKLSKSQREEVATKGFVVDLMFELEIGLESRLEAKLEAKFQRYVGALMEDNRHQIGQVIDYIKMSNERLDRRTGKLEDWLSNHEDRLGKLETVK